MRRQREGAAADVARPSTPPLLEPNGEDMQLLRRSALRPGAAATTAATAVVTATATSQDMRLEKLAPRRSRGGLLFARKRPATPDAESDAARRQQGRMPAVDVLRSIVMEKLVGRRRLPLVGLDAEYKKIYQMVKQTVVAGEGNSMLVIGARGSEKTAVCL